MAFDANQWRSERLRLLQKLQANIDTARWLREQSLRTLRQAVELMSVVDQARSERSFRDCDTNPGRFYIDGEDPRRHGEAKRDEQ
jgi:hypothetical protein